MLYHVNQKYFIKKETTAFMGGFFISKSSIYRWSV